MVIIRVQLESILQSKILLKYFRIQRKLRKFLCVYLFPGLYHDLFLCNTNPLMTCGNIEVRTRFYSSLTVIHKSYHRLVKEKVKEY